MSGQSKDISGRLAVWVVISFTVIATLCATLFSFAENGTYFAQLLIYVSPLEQSAYTNSSSFRYNP